MERLVGVYRPFQICLHSHRRSQEVCKAVSLTDLGTFNSRSDTTQKVTVYTEGKNKLPVLFIKRNFILYNQINQKKIYIYYFIFFLKLPTDTTWIKPT